ncbi:hypothetical protein [Streptomyces sp. NPDC058457]|uniref:hypothetical protein n=1 Tax=Streptomyces sp. NPDC058457 TaxID=3346507 RepID=UPI00365E1D3A
METDDPRRARQTSQNGALRSSGVAPGLAQLNTILRVTGATAPTVPLPMLGLRTIDQRDIAGDPRVRRTIQETFDVLLQEPAPAI